MVPPTESLRFVAGELGKCGRNLEEIGAKFWVPIASEFFFLTWRNAYLHVHDLGHIGKLEANLDSFKTPLRPDLMLDRKRRSKTKNGVFRSGFFD